MWEFLLKNWLNIITHILVPLITLLGGWILGSFRERTKERYKNLKTHFEEIQQEAEKIIPGLSVSELHGRIVFANGRNEYISPIILPKASDALTAHFPNEANAIRGFELGINDHNQHYERFCLKLKGVVKSNGLELLNINENSPSPHIWDNVFWIFFSWWEDHSKGKTPTFDVTKLETDKNFGENQLIAAGCHSQAIVYAETEEGKEKCKAAITEIACNTEYEEEAIEIIHSAKKLTGEITITVSNLKDNLARITRFELWQGRHRIFTKQKQCPICQKYI